HIANAWARYETNARPEVGKIEQEQINVACQFMQVYRDDTVGQNSSIANDYQVEELAERMSDLRLKCKRPERARIADARKRIESHEQVNGPQATPMGGQEYGHPVSVPLTGQGNVSGG